MRTNTKILILIVFTQFAMCGTWMLMTLAHMWLEEGFGLHPYISLPVAGMLTLMPYIIYSLWFESDRPTTTFDLETIELPINKENTHD